MNSKRIWFPVLTGLLVLGFLLGLGSVGTTAKADSPGTTTDPTSITMGTSTDAGTVTDPGTTTEPTTTTSTSGTTTATTPTTTVTTPTTNLGSTNAGTTTQPAITQSGSQSSDPSATPSTVTAPGQTSSTPTGETVTEGTTPTTPTAPCDTTEITCGNNASTELAMVSQVCSTSSDFTTLNVNITTAMGAPINTVNIEPMTSCLNELAITQIVEQYCEGCSIIVIPPPAPVIYVPVPGTNTVTVEEGTTSYTTTVVNNITTPVEVPTPTAGTNTNKLIAYCLAAPVVQATGRPSSLVYLPVGQALNGSYKGAAPASYKTGKGMTCSGTETLSDTSFVPMFTLTVPKSFVDEGLRLCASPVNPGGKTLCRTLKINAGATLSIPITSNISAKVLQTVKAVPPKSKKQIAAAISAFSTVVSGSKKTSGSSKTSGKKSGTTKTVTRLTKKLATDKTSHGKA